MTVLMADNGRCNITGLCILRDEGAEGNEARGVAGEFRTPLS